jgi:hypothetical protein
MLRAPVRPSAQKKGCRRGQSEFLRPGLRVREDPQGYPAPGYLLGTGDLGAGGPRPQLGRLAAAATFRSDTH